MDTLSPAAGGTLGAFRPHAAALPQASTLARMAFLLVTAVE